VRPGGANIVFKLSEIPENRNTVIPSFLINFFFVRNSIELPLINFLLSKLSLSYPLFKLLSAFTVHLGLIYMHGPKCKRHRHLHAISDTNWRLTVAGAGTEVGATVLDYPRIYIYIYVFVTVYLYLYLLRLGICVVCIIDTKFIVR